MIDAIVLALGLAMDAAAVAAARAVSGADRRDVLRMAATFGLFQAGMAAIGWAAGATAMRWIARWDHWVAFGLLVTIGGKMLLESSRSGSPDGEDASRLTGRVLLLLAVATSIDALAAGVTLPVLDVAVLFAVASIGAVAFAMTIAGAMAARCVGEPGHRSFEVFGGIALIVIGVKTLLDHLM